METVISALKAIFWGVVVLSLLVFVHEGGHYLAARAFKVRVTEFFLGMPCRYKISRKSEKVGTEFGVTPILIGGYNRICGMSSEPDELLAQALVIVTEAGRIEVSQLAERLGCDEDRAYGIAATAQKHNVGIDGMGSVGLIVGATVGQWIDQTGIDPAQFTGPILSPGYGWQGAEAEDLTTLFKGTHGNVLVTVSRSIASHGPDISALSEATEAIALDVRHAIMQAEEETTKEQQ